MITRVVRPVLWVCLVTGLILGAGIQPAAAQDGSPSPGFATPEDAVRAYLRGVADADVAQVLGAAAIDEMAEGFDFVAYVERLGAWVPSQAPAPATDPFMVDLNRFQQTAQLLGQTRMLMYSLFTSEQLDGAPVAPVDANWAAVFMTQVDPGRLAGLEIVDVEMADADLQAGERYLANAARQAAISGADELTERVARVSLEGRTYLVGFTLLRFGDGWKVASQYSPISGMPATGAAAPVDAP